MNSFDDIEEEIPYSNLQLSQGLTELRVKTTTKTTDGFIETRIERLKIIQQLDSADQQQTKNICISRPFKKSITNTICLSVEDVKLASYVDKNDCWNVFNSLFRRVFVYGKIVLINQYSKSDKTCLKFSLDDSSDIVIATMNISKESRRLVSNQAGRLTMERNKLKRKKEIGINVGGKFHRPESEMNLSIMKNLSILQAATVRNVREQSMSFLLGPIKQKALIQATPYKNNKNEVQLSIIEISLDDEIELAFKRQLNKLYLKEYLCNRTYVNKE